MANPLKGLNQEHPDGRPGFVTGSASGATETSSIPWPGRFEAKSPSDQGTTRVSNKATSMEDESSRAHANESQSSDIGSKNAGSDNTELV